MNKIKINNYILVFLLMFCIVATGQAQNDTIFLDEILIVAREKDQLLKTNINASALEMKNKHDVGEIFTTIPGFGVVKRGNFAMEPVLRGFKNDQLNVQYNSGCTSSNACPNRMDPTISQISPEEIEKLEIIKGPYSVRFGQSIGGIVNLVTKKPLKADEFTIKGSLDGGFMSNGSNFYSGINLWMADKKYDVTLNAGYKDFGNYESGSGQEIASSFRRIGYALKVGYNPKENQRLQLYWKQGFASDIMHAGLPMDADKDNSSSLSLDYQIQNISPVILSYKIKLFGSYVDHEMSNTNRPNYSMVHAVTPVTAEVYGGRTEFNLNLSGTDMMYLGADYKYIGKDGKRTREVYFNPCNEMYFDPPKEFEDLVWQDSKLNDIGVFVENRLQATSNLLWIIGARFDMVSYAIDNPAPDFKEQYNNEINPDNHPDFSVNTSLAWQINETLKLQWALGRGVRAPALDELFINHLSIGMDAYEYLGNPNLKSEVNYQTDIRIDKSWEHVSMFGSVFYSYLNDYITARLDTTLDKKFLPCKPPEHAKRFTNIDEAFMTGFEAGLQVSFLTNFKYSLSGSYTYAQNTTWDEPLPEIPPFTINTSLRYSIEKFEAFVNARIAADQNRVSESFAETATPGFAVLDISLEYEPFGFLSIYGSVTNLLNKNYVEHLSRAYKNMDTQSLYYEPGRSFNIGLKLQF